MGSRRTGFVVTSGNSNSNFGRSNAGILKERANMSFMLVVMFFAVFGLIVLTEIFLIDERRGATGSTGALGGHRNGHRLAAAPDRPDYEEVLADDYTNLKGGFDAQIGLLLMNNNPTAKIDGINADPRSLPSLPPSLELRLPILDKNLHMTDAEWLPVTNTKYEFILFA